MKDDKTVFVVYKGIKIDLEANPSLRRQIEVRPFDSSLKYLQDLVQGYIEHYVIDDALDKLHIDMWINEEGKYQEGFEPTFALLHEGRLYDYIMGPCVFSKYNDKGETLGLSLDEMNIVIDWLNNQDVVGMVRRSDDMPFPVIKVEK